MNLPLVSCIMPTANRAKYIPNAIDNFLKQNYDNKELIIIDDGEQSIAFLLPQSNSIKYFYYENKLGTIGTKRNLACSKADGDIIMHWDDDDWYAKDWITKQLHYLKESQADICGIEHVNFYSPITDTFWIGTSQNRNKGYTPQWLSGATIAYKKSFWLKHPFQDRNTGEDDAFILKSGASVFAHDYIDGFVAVLHQKNTTTKYFEHPRTKSH